MAVSGSGRVSYGARGQGLASAGPLCLSCSILKMHLLTLLTASCAACFPCEAGLQVFWTQRRSTPDLGPLARILADDPDADIPSSIGFDSLKSLPTTLPWLRRLEPPAPEPAATAAAAAAGPGPGAAGSSKGNPGEQQATAGNPGEQRGAAAAAPAGDAQAAESPGHELMRRPTFEAIAAALRQQLGLTLFGFDLVFDRVAGKCSAGRSLSSGCCMSLWELQMY